MRIPGLLGLLAVLNQGMQGNMSPLKKFLRNSGSRTFIIEVGNITNAMTNMGGLLERAFDVFVLQEHSVHGLTSPRSTLS